MKGISAIIATLLLLVITIGLAVTAYFYINNMLQKTISKQINIEPAGCSNNEIYLIIWNMGTEELKDTDFRILLNNKQPTKITFNPTTIPPRNSTIVNITSAQSGMNTVLIVTQSGSQRHNVFC